MRKPGLLSLIPIAGLAAGALLAGAGADSSFNAERYLDHIKFLASPEMKGRESGSPELEKAARYIAGYFKADGLKTLDGNSYLQPFEITTSAKLGKANRFDVGITGEKAGAESESLQEGKEFVPINFSSRGKASGGVVFAGYGITAPEYNYDDYAGIDAHGKFVVVLSTSRRSSTRRACSRARSTPTIPRPTARPPTRANTAPPA